MICSITSSGLLMPPDQNESQMRSILLLSSPVITEATLVTSGGSRAGIGAVGGSREPWDMRGAGDQLSVESASPSTDAAAA